MELTDKAALQAWHEAQHQDDDEPAIAPPVDALDPKTVVALVMLICCPDSNGSIIWKTATRRLAVIAGLVMPELGKLTFDRIAADLTKAGIPTCRATLSNISVLLSEACGLSRSDKGQAAREAYRQRACAVWGKRAERNRKTVRQEAETVDSQ